MSASRHLACKVCRDRKVRCDGGRPSCEKCLQSGETCVYVSPARQSKVDLIENIASLQERLANAESRLESIPSYSNSSSPSLNTTFVGPSSPSVSDVHIPKTPANRQLPPTCSDLWTETAAGYSCSNQLGSASAFCPMSTTAMETSSDESNIFPWSIPLLPTVEEPMNPLHRKNTGEVNCPSGLSLPSLREVRAWNEQLMGENNDPDACTVFRELAAFLSVMFTNQGYISGISNTIADYMAWARQAPNINQLSMLEVFETRAREVADFAATRHWIAFQDLQKSLSMSETFRRKLSLLEKELMSDGSEMAYFFATQYNIQSDLRHQRRS